MMPAESNPYLTVMPKCLLGGDHRSSRVEPVPTSRFMLHRPSAQATNPIAATGKRKDPRARASASRNPPP